MEIIKAGLENLPDVARLFDLYRQFYKCDPDLPLATRFIRERMQNGESDIFLATTGEFSLGAQGFVQLYPSFCSIDAAKIYILYDLYVDEKHRKSGVGESLMNRARQWAEDNDAVRLDLLTEFTNEAGQHLYEKLGYKKTLLDYHAYSLEIA